jgi:hypothetical protein
MVVRLYGAALAAVSLLAGCGATGGGSAGTAAQAPVSQGPTTVVKGNTPAQLYSHIGRQVRACWLGSRNPVLPKHVFRAEAGAGGRSGNTTRIEIHEQTPDRKLGLRAFTIDFQPVRDGTQIVTQNHKLPYPLGQKLVSDVGYWAQGGANCEGPAQAAGGAPRGSVSGPRITR